MTHPVRGGPAAGSGLALLFALLLLGDARPVEAQAQAQASGEAELVRAARALEHFEVRQLCHDPDFALPEAVRAVVDGASTSLIEHLLTSDEGAVRALAIGALHQRLGPRVLPLLVPLIDDERAAPPRLVPLSRVVDGARDFELPTEPQSVGELARGLLEHYLQLAGYYGGFEGHHGRPGFEAYWEERRDREHCLGWWRAALERASRSSSPTPADRLDEIAALRAEIDRLPSVERAWVLLALSAPWEGGVREWGSAELARPDEVVAACGPLAERGLLLALLRGEDLGSEDPDVRLSEPTAFPYERVVPFVLRHARDLLPADAGPEFLELERRHLSGEPVGDAPSCITASWSIAAADLAPARASDVLVEALERHRRGTSTSDQDRRCFLAQALWRHAGASELERIVDWFCGEEPGRGAFGFGRHRFADWLGDPTRAALLRAILLDPRSARFDWQTLRRLAGAVNASAGRVVLSRGELARARHPLGEGHYRWAAPEKLAIHAAETAALEATLGLWRERLAAWARGPY